MAEGEWKAVQNVFSPAARADMALRRAESALDDLEVFRESGLLRTQPERETMLLRGAIRDLIDAVRALT